jgi:F-type H+-transporting ATPase subunit delta
VKNLSIAKRYAKALLLVGKEDNNADTYREELESFTSILKQESDLEKVIDNPLYDAASRKRILTTIIEKFDFSIIVKTFLLLLFDKGRIKFIDSITDFYKQLTDDLKGIAHAKLVSASELAPETLDKVKTALSQKTGKEILLDVEVDNSLIGGIITRIGDLVLDGSIKTQLLNMKKALKKGEGI